MLRMELESDMVKPPVTRLAQDMFLPFTWGSLRFLVTGLMTRKGEGPEWLCIVLKF